MHAFRLRLFTVVVALVLAAAACGDDAATDSAVLPVDSGDGRGGVATEPVCVPDEPECEDTATVADDGQDPETVDDDASSVGMTVDGGLTVTEALATDASGVLAVRGHGVIDEAGARLCETLVSGGERYECGGASLVVEGLDLDTTGAEVVHDDGLTYTDAEITVFGELVNGVLVVDDQVIG